MKKYHKVEGAKVEGSKLVLRVNGRSYTVELSNVSDRLRFAGELERKQFVVSPSGYGIHWPLVDEDLSIDALIKSGTQQSKLKLKLPSRRNKTVETS